MFYRSLLCATCCTSYTYPSILLLLFNFTRKKKTEGRPLNQHLPHLWIQPSSDSNPSLRSNSPAPPWPPARRRTRAPACTRRSHWERRRRPSDRSSVSWTERAGGRRHRARSDRARSSTVRPSTTIAWSRPSNPGSRTKTSAAWMSSPRPTWIKA